MKTLTQTAIAAILLLAGAQVLAQDVADDVEGPAAPAARVVTLEEAQQLAVDNNPTMKNVGETIVQADAMIQGAWAMLLPNLNANASVTRNQREVAMEMPGPSTMEVTPATDPNYPGHTHDIIVTPSATGEKLVIQEKWGQSFGFTANMTLFNPRSIPLIKNAYASSDRTRLSAQVSKNDLLFAVTAAYYQTHMFKETIAVTEENLAVAKEFHRQTQARMKVGQTTAIDVMRAELSVLDAQRMKANAEDSYDEARSALGYLIGVKERFEIAGPADSPSVDGDVDTLKRRALEDRIEVKTAELDLEMASRSKKETYTKWLPTFDVTYQWSWNSAEGFSGEKDSWMLIFGAKWSLLEGGGRFAELKDRESKIRMAQNAKDQLLLDIEKEVEDRHREVGKEKRNVDFSEKQVNLAEENHRMISKQYEVGVATSLDLLDSSTQLANQRIQQVLDRLRFDIAMLSLEKAVGEYHSLSRVETR